MYSLLVFILLFIFSCAAKKEIPKTESIVEVNPKLIFLNYTIFEDAKGVKSVHFINKAVVDGKPRNSSNKYIKTGHIGDLKCSQLDKNFKPAGQLQPQQFKQFNQERSKVFSELLLLGV